MFSTLEATYVQQVGCFLLPGFSMVALDQIIESLWVANLGQLVRRYEWFVISADGDLVSTDRGLVISPDEAIDAGRDFSLILLVSSPQSKVIAAPNVIPWLRSLSHTRCRLGAIGDATVLLAQAGLLDGYRCAVPEPLQQDFAAEFPDIRICHEPFCLVHDRVTCTGVTAVVDMMLGIISDEFGLKAGDEVAYQLTHNGIACQRPAEYRTWPLSRQTTDRRLTKAIELMAYHIAEPMRIFAIAHRIGASERKIERLFQGEFHCSPSHFYLRLRLQKAHDLVTHSRQSISYIAHECGFFDASHFDKYYRATFHETPKYTREVTQTILTGNRAGDLPGERPRQ